MTGVKQDWVVNTANLAPVLGGMSSDRPVPPPNYGSTQTLRHQHLGPRSPKFGGELAHVRWPNVEKIRQHYDIVR
jgi:hypothetical protein